MSSTFIFTDMHTHTHAVLVRLDQIILRVRHPKPPWQTCEAFWLLTLVPFPQSLKARDPSDSKLGAGPLSEIGGHLAGNKKKLQPSSQGSSCPASQFVLLDPWAAKQEATQKLHFWNKAALSPGPGFPETRLRKREMRELHGSQRSGEKLAPEQKLFPKQLAKLESSNWCRREICPAALHVLSAFSGALASQNQLSMWH